MFVMVLWVVLFCCYLGCSRMWCWTYIYIYIYILDWVTVPMISVSIVSFIFTGCGSGYTVIGILRIDFGPIVLSSLWEVVNES